MWFPAQLSSQGLPLQCPLLFILFTLCSLFQGLYILLPKFMDIIKKLSQFSFKQQFNCKFLVQGCLHNLLQFQISWWKYAVQKECCKPPTPAPNFTFHITIVKPVCHLGQLLAWHQRNVTDEDCQNRFPFEYSKCFLWATIHCFYEGSSFLIPFLHLRFYFFISKFHKM